MHDHLTGLLSRVEFNRQVEKCLHAGTTSALLIFDVDHLMYVNDALGYKAGDAVMVAIAATIQRIAGNALTARFGGDEFVVFLEGDQAHAGKLAERVRAAVEQQFQAERSSTRARQVVASGTSLLTLSAGGAISSAGERFADVYQRADMALCAAKSAGRDCVRWSPTGSVR